MEVGIAIKIAALIPLKPLGFNKNKTLPGSWRFVTTAQVR